MNERKDLQYSILIADDEVHILRNLEGILRANGFENVLTCSDARKVIGMIEGNHVEVLLLDLTMPHISGRELLPELRESFPDLPIIIVTGTSEVSVAVECMKLGVFDYLVKTIEESKLITSVSHAMEFRDLQRENTALKNHLVSSSLEHPEVLSEVIVADDAMHSIYLYLESIAPSSQTVLITGDTGVGKEVVAEALHAMSGRKGEFVTINAAGLDDNLFSDALFGHVREAFTGANHDRKGMIRRAKEGTLFLDEIGDLTTKSQVALLRLLESREYYPLGSDLPQRSDARIVVASNRDIKQMVQEGSFRKDLYFRLRTHHVHVPALRSRPADIPPLFEHFVFEAQAEYARKITTISPDVYRHLRRYAYPGNVRELRSIAFELVGVNKTGMISAEDVTRLLTTGDHLDAEVSREPLLISGTSFPTIREATEYLIEEALRRCNGNQSKAARLLGISPPALNRRLRTTNGVSINKA